MLKNNNMAAELVLDDLTKACKAVQNWSIYTQYSYQAKKACNVLEQMILQGSARFLFSI